MEIEKVSKCKVIRDEATIEKIKSCKSPLFELRDFLAYYYLSIGDKFYMVQADDYTTPFNPTLSYYELTLEQFESEFERFKSQFKNDDRLEQKYKISNTEEFLKENKEKIKEKSKKEKIDDIEDNIKYYEDMLVKASANLEASKKELKKLTKVKVMKK